MRKQRLPKVAEDYLDAQLEKMTSAEQGSTARHKWIRFSPDKPTGIAFILVGFVFALLTLLLRADMFFSVVMVFVVLILTGYGACHIKMDDRELR